MSRAKTSYKFRPLDYKPFGRDRKLPIHDARIPNSGIKMDFPISDLFVGKTAVISPHFDDASLNYGGGIAAFSMAGGDIHTVNVSPGHRAPIKGLHDSDVEGKIAKRISEGKKEGKILGTTFHFLDLRQLYEQKRITRAEAQKFYLKLDELNPSTLVVPGPFDTHPDHQHSRILALNWAAGQALQGRPKVILEAPSMWGSVPETHITHMLELKKGVNTLRTRAQKAHGSQMERTAFDEASSLRAIANGIIAGEHKHGLVPKTPRLGPTELYSQHVIVRQGSRLVFTRLTGELKQKILGTGK